MAAGRDDAASSSKNGIMLFSVDELERAVGERQLGRVGDLVPLALGRRASGAPPRPSRGETSTPVTSAPGQRAAASRATAPLPVPRSSTRAGGAGSASSAASIGRSRVSSTRVASHSGASRSKFLRQPAAEEPPEPRPRTTTSVTSRVEALAAGHRDGDPQLVAEPDAGQPRGIAAADRERDETVRVLVDDQLAGRCVRERAGDDGVVAVEREPDLDAVAVGDAEPVDVLRVGRSSRRCRSDRPTSTVAEICVLPTCGSGTSTRTSVRRLERRARAPRSATPAARCAAAGAKTSRA